MKKFICVIPRQKAGDLSNVRYQAQGNRALDYPGTTRFPVIPLIWGYGQEGEEIRVIALSADYDNCRGNLELLEEELTGDSPVPRGWRWWRSPLTRAWTAISPPFKS